MKKNNENKPTVQTSAADCFVYTKLYFEITSFVFWATV